MKLPVIGGTKHLVAAAVGAVDIFARLQDEQKGTTSGKFFTPMADKVRTVVTAGALLGNMLGKGKLQAATEGALLASIPLLELSLYRGFVAAGQSTPFFLQRPRVQAASAGASFAASDGFVETAANGGLPIVTTGVSVTNSGSGRVY